MTHYHSYMDRQAVSSATHQALLDLNRPQKAPKGGLSMKLGALAACIALFLGIGAHFRPATAPVTTPTLPTAPVTSPIPTVTTPPIQDDVGVADRQAFTAQGPADGSKLMFPMIAGVDYADATNTPEAAPAIIFPKGSFAVPLDKEDIQKLFWGTDGKPEVENPKTDPGDFPVMLMNWAGYTISGEAMYDGNGDLWELRVWGTKEEDSFTLRAAVGQLPPTCVVLKSTVTTDVLGVEVSGWYQSFDRDRDGEVEHVCTSQFIANGVGFRFQNVGSGGMKAGGDVADDLGGAKLFNQMVVTQLCHADGFYLDQFAHNDNIPAWTEESYDVFADALAGAESFAFSHPEADFLAYLPTEGPEGYGDFHARLSYQEGVKKSFYVRWTRGYDDVEVDIHLPEGGEVFSNPVDVTVPASYDWRLYDGSISDCVPEEYQADFYKPTFRASDMSLEVVKARMNDKDTGGQSCNFWVLHDDGTMVGYSCSGVSAEYVWGLVEKAL